MNTDIPRPRTVVAAVISRRNNNLAGAQPSLPWRPVAIGLGLLLWALAVPRSHAANGNDTWTTGAGDGSGNWSVSTNWVATSANKPPISGDTLFFGATTGVTTLTDNLMTIATFNVAGITFNSGAATYTINAGTVSSNPSGFTLTGNILNSSTARQTINDNISLSTALHTITMTAAGGNIVLGGTVSGGGSLEALGSGTLTLSGANTYTGSTWLNSGNVTLAINSAGALGTGTFVISSGTIDNTSGAAITGLTNNPAVSIASGASFAFSNSAGTTNNSLNLGTGAVTLNGNTTITLNGAGALTLGATTVAAANTLTVNNGSGTASTTVLNISSYALSTGATADVITNAANVNISGAVTGGATPLNKGGAGNLTLGGVNTYSGATTVTSGTLTITGQMGNSNVVIQGAALLLNGASAINQNVLTINTASDIVTENTNNAISGNASVNQTAGIVTLSSSNNYTGTYGLTSGTLNINNAGALGTGTLVINSGAINNTSGAAITGQGNNPTIAIPNGITMAFSTAAGTVNNSLNLGNGPVLLAGNWTVNLNGAGALTLGGTATFSAAGQITANLGSGTASTTALNLGGINLGSAAGTFNDIITGAANINIPGAVGNGAAIAGHLNYTGSGTLTLSGSSGTLTLGLNANGGVTILSGTITSAAPIAANTGGTFTETNSGVVGPGAASITAAGGIINLGGINTYTGSTATSSGTFNLTGTLAGATAISTSGGSFVESSAATISGAGASLTTINGTTSLNAANTYTGATIVNGGVLLLSNTGAIQSSALTLENNATLRLRSDVSGSFATASGSIGSSFTIDVDKLTSATNNTLQLGNFSSAGNTLTTTNNSGGGGSDYSLKIGTISYGDVAPALTNNMVSGTTTFSAVTFANLAARTLTVTSATSAVTVIGTVTQNGTNAVTITDSGPGTLVLNGSNNYTGGTVISNSLSGTLVLDNSANNGASLAGSAVSVNGAGGSATVNTLLIKGNYLIGSSGNGTVTINNANTLSMADGTINTLTVKSPSTTTVSLNLNGAVPKLLFEAGNSSTDEIILSGILAMNTNGATISITQLPSTALVTGLYPLITYNSLTGSGTFSLVNTSIPNAQVSLVSTGTAELLKVIAFDNSQLTISPTPVFIGNAIVGQAAGSGTAMLTNTGTAGSGAADYSTSSTGSVTVSPAASAGNGGTGATLAVGQSQTLTVTGTGSVGSVSGTGVVLGTISASNINNPTNGNAGPVNVVANVYDPAIITPGANGITITNSGTGSNGANSLIASAKVTVNTINTNSSVTQDAGSWVPLTPGPIATGSSATIASINGAVAPSGNAGLLNGTYQATTTLQVASVTSSGGAIAGGTSTYNNNSYVMTATVSGNTSNSRTNTYEADIINSYAGYGIQSSTTGTAATHTNTGGGGTTVATIVYGTASDSTQLQMSFDTSPVENSDFASRASDILTINGSSNGINIVGFGSNNDGRLLTDEYVLTMSYDLSATGLAYIVQNTSSGWINAVALNSNGNEMDDGGVSAKNETFAQYLLNNGGTPTLGDYGYSNGVAWAVLDHTATGDQGLTEFAVTAQAVPEPGTYAMIFGGFGMLIAFRRLRRRLG